LELTRLFSLDKDLYHNKMEMPTSISSVLDSALEVIYGLQPLVEPTVVLGKVNDEKLASDNFTKKKVINVLVLSVGTKNETM